MTDRRATPYFIITSLIALTPCGVTPAIKSREKLAIGTRSELGEWD